MCGIIGAPFVGMNEKIFFTVVHYYDFIGLFDVVISFYLMFCYAKNVSEPFHNRLFGDVLIRLLSFWTY